MIAETPVIRVLLVMDEVVLRTGLRMLIESWPEMQCMAETGRIPDALRDVERIKPDVLICDVNPSAGDSDREFLRALVSSAGAGSILLMSGDDQPEARVQAIGAGVNGILSKADAPGEMRKAILKVYSGEVWLDRLTGSQFILRITRPSLGDRSDPARFKVRSLTQRERQIAHLICQGMQNEEIGRRLSISDTTVRHHLTSIFAKIGVSNRLELTVFLYRNNFAGSLIENNLALSRSAV